MPRLHRVNIPRPPGLGPRPRRPRPARLPLPTDGGLGCPRVVATNRMAYGGPHRSLRLIDRKPAAVSPFLSASLSARADGLPLEWIVKKERLKHPGPAATRRHGARGLVR